MRSDGRFDVRSLCRGVLVLAGLCACQPRADESRTRDTPPTDTPTSNTPTSDTPTSNTPTSNTPTSNTPTSNTPTSNTPTSNTPTSDTPTNDTAAAVAGHVPAAASAIIAADRLIRPDGTGHARAGVTIGQLRRRLPAGFTLHAPAPFMVDVHGMPVVSGADTLYYVLVVAGEPSADDAAIEFVATLNDQFRTDAGVGPGTTLADAASAYGEPTLSSRRPTPESAPAGVWGNLHSSWSRKLDPAFRPSALRGRITGV
jgi:hypothetical protein